VAEAKKASATMVKRLYEIVISETRLWFSQSARQLSYGSDHHACKLSPSKHGSPTDKRSGDAADLLPLVRF
jgi:hypothetical protein